MKTRKIKNGSSTKSPIRLRHFGLVGFGKEIEVPEDVAISLCRYNPKAWKPVKWTVPALELVKLQNDAGSALVVNGEHVPQDGILEIEKADALVLLERAPDSWSPVKWDPKKPAPAGSPESSEPKK